MLLSRPRQTSPVVLTPRTRSSQMLRLLKVFPHFTLSNSLSGWVLRQAVSTSEPQKGCLPASQPSFRPWQRRV